MGEHNKQLGLLHVQVLNMCAHSVVNRAVETRTLNDLLAKAEAMGCTEDADDMADALTILLAWCYSKRVAAAETMVHRYAPEEIESVGVLQIARWPREDAEEGE